ncbi:MAG TPA: glycosyltransferase family 4 protein [Pyrinomonadaceae bacterium]
MLLNQCFYPDVVSTAQHLTDLATELSRRGHAVTVLTSDRGYDNPSVRFQRRECWQGIDIIRIPSFSWGKSSKLKRAVNFSSFLFICALRMLFVRRVDAVVALTSPPLISVLAALYTHFTRARLYCWIMDLNPDEAIAAGWLKEQSITARMLKRMMNYSLRQAAHVVVLDRFMNERVRRSGVNRNGISVLAPWSQSDVVGYSGSGREQFRTAHDLDGKFVVMYSGNHSPCHPLDTLLNAAFNLHDRQDLVFCFIGGGSEHEKVQRFAQQHGLTNIKRLSYQPLNQLSASLSAADLHVVVMGDPFVGVIHPCKIYNIIAVGSPILYIGPDQSHVTDLATHLNGRLLTARHNDHATVAQHILNASLSRSEQSRDQANQKSPFSKEVLLPQLCAIVESGTDEVALLPRSMPTESVLSITNEPGR